VRDPTVLNLLGQKYPKAEITIKSGTKERILLASASLFARDGYFGVSVKDIANAVGIKPASLYNHYESKEALWKAVLERIQELYLMLFSRFEAVHAQAESLSDIINNLFYELKEASQMFSLYGISMVQSEQFHSDMAADMYHGLFINYSVALIKKQLDDCIESGMSDPFDTHTVASMIMYSFLILNNIRVHEDMGRNVPVNVPNQIDSIRDMILCMVNNGVNSKKAIN